MPRYSDEYKESIVRKMMPPRSMTVAEISRETSICVATLYTWRDKYRKEGKAVPADASNPEYWSGESKLAVVIETAALNETELSEYCRTKGLYVEQVDSWKQAAISGTASEPENRRAIQRSQKQDRQKIKKLEREVCRKDKALAEVSALLVLKKKAQSLWGESEEE